MKISTIDKIDRVASVMQSECHMAGLKSTIERELATRGIAVAESYEASVSIYSDGRMSVYVSFMVDKDSDDDEQYYNLMGLHESSIGSAEALSSWWQKKVYQLPQDTEITISFSISAPLRADDALTLRQLGKIHTTVEEARVTEYVSCAI